jgi:ketosteroid isomerase-like protein
MKRVLFVVLAGMLMSHGGAGQVAGTVEQDLIKLDQALADAAVKKDRAMFERGYADDYVYTHSNGSVLNKAQDIAETMSADIKWTSTTQDDLKVRVYGDVGIVTGRQVLNGTAKGYVSGARRFTDIFVKRNGRWQQVGGQTTLIPTK